MQCLVAKHLLQGGSQILMLLDVDVPVAHLHKPLNVNVIMPLHVLVVRNPNYKVTLRGAHAGAAQVHTLFYYASAQTA